MEPVTGRESTEGCHLERESDTEREPPRKGWTRNTASPHERLGLTGQSGESHPKETEDRNEIMKGLGQKLSTIAEKLKKQNIHVSNTANMGLRGGS